MANSNAASLLVILLIVLVLLSIVAIFYLYITARNRERLALIEKGMDPNLARNDFWLQAGIVVGGAGAGLLFDGLIPDSTRGPLFAMLFAGVGLVVFNVLRRARMHRNKGVS